MDSNLPEFTRRRLDPAARYGLRLTLFLLAGILVAIPFAWLLVEITMDDEVIGFDLAAAESMFEAKQRFGWLPELLNGISILGSPVVLWVLVPAVAVYLWTRRQRRLVAYLVTTTLGGALLNTAVKIAVNRPRPSFRDPAALTFQEGKSFPSGHTMSATVCYGALLLIFLPLLEQPRRRAAVAATAGLVAVIAASRLGLGVHYVSDVAAGLVLGAAWLAASTAAFSIWRVERGKPPVDTLAGVEPEVRADLKPRAG